VVILFHLFVQNLVLTHTLKAAPIANALRGPFGFAQGKLLKRRSSTGMHAFVSFSRNL